MNLENLHQAADHFLQRYPGGFSHPDIQAIGKKHRMDKMTALTQDVFAPDNFKHTQQIVDGFMTIVNRSSMISLFEKPKLKDFMGTLSPQLKDILANGLKNFFHGEEGLGFDMILNVLAEGKLAKWSLMTICPVYFAPDYHVYVKPNTAKGIIKFLDLETLHYKPRPTYDFYVEFRRLIKIMKSEVDPTLAPNNAAFTGFLMMSMESLGS